MSYLDNPQTKFARLSATHRVEREAGPSVVASVTKVQRYVEMREGHIWRELPPAEAFLRRFFDPDFENIKCGTFVRSAKDPTIFPLSLKTITGMTLPEVSQHRIFPKIAGSDLMQAPV